MVPDWYFLDIPDANCSGCPEGSRCVRPFEWSDPVHCLANKFLKVSDLAYEDKGFTVSHFNAIVALVLLLVFTIIAMGTLILFKKREPPVVNVQGAPPTVKVIKQRVYRRDDSIIDEDDFQSIALKELP